MQHQPPSKVLPGQKLISRHRINKLLTRIFFPYRTPSGPLRYLSQASIEPVAVPQADDAVLAQGGALFGLWRTIPGGHKWHHYFESYEEILRPLRDRPIRMLEIGVWGGGSLKLWRRYLHPDSVIVGVDIDPTCGQYDDPTEKVFVRIGDQGNHGFLEQVVREFGPFDFILDDGSHYCSHMIQSFDYLFLNGLAGEGTYMVEDTATNFWRSHRNQPYSFLQLAKDLVDLMQQHYVQFQSSVHFEPGNAQRTHRAMVPRVASLIKEVTFRDSIVIIRKRALAQLPADLRT